MFLIYRLVIRNDSIWDTLVFRKVQAAIGGRVKIIITGSAPLEQKVLDFVRSSFGCLVRIHFYIRWTAYQVG